MIGWLLILFVTLPIAEIALIIEVEQRLGLGWSGILLIALVTGILGAALARRQGLRTLARINGLLAQGRLPTTELLEGLLILLAGAVLITPGFLTDLVGLGLLLPASRRLFIKAVSRYFQTKIAAGSFHVSSTAMPDDPNGRSDDSSEEPVGLDQTGHDHSGDRPMKYVRNEALDKRASQKSG